MIACYSLALLLLLLLLLPGIPFMSLGTEQQQLSQQADECLDPYKTPQQQIQAGVEMMRGKPEPKSRPDSHSD
jgi:hypothetical protein